MDKSGKTSASDIAVNVGAGLPSLLGLETLQTTVNPKTNIPTDFLSGVKATDTRDGDITTNIKVYLKENGQYAEITTPKSYIIKNLGTITVKYEITDNNKNTVASEVSLNVTSGMPIFTGLDNLQTTVNPRVDIPMNLLSGVKAKDGKEVDLTANIKVYLKNQSGQYGLVNNSTTYLVDVPTILELKYQITDSYTQTTEVEKTLNVIQEPLVVPQLQLKPNDPTFDPNNPEWNQYMCKNRAEYLTPIKVLEVRAMGEAMVRSGTNDMSKSEYLSKLNKWQLALNNVNGKPMGTDAGGQYIVPNTAFPERLHEDGCNQILVGKKNNGVGGVGLA